VTQGVGILVKPTLEELAVDGAKEFAKDVFYSVKNVIFGEKDPRKVAAGKALKKFLEWVQQQLKISRLSPEKIKLHIKDVKKFISINCRNSLLKISETGFLA